MKYYSVFRRRSKRGFAKKAGKSRDDVMQILKRISPARLNGGTTLIKKLGRFINEAIKFMKRRAAVRPLSDTRRDFESLCASNFFFISANISGLNLH